MRLCKICTIILFILFISVACGRGTGQNEEQANRQEEGGFTGEFAHAQITEVLTVAALQQYGVILREAEETLRTELAKDGIDFSINLTLYQWDDVDSHIAAELAKFVTGQGYDIVMLTAEHPIDTYIRHGFLTDINELIDNYSNREDFFFNILEAMEIDGSIYTFPLDFAFQYIGINANLPQSFIERFAQYQSITIRELSNLYTDLQAEYPEFEHLTIGRPLPVSVSIQQYMSGYINWSHGTLAPITLAPFVSYLRDIQEAFYNHAKHGNWWESDMFTSPISADFLQMEAERYVFSNSRGFLSTVNALLDFEVPFFVHYIPIADESGHLLAHGAAQRMFGVSTDANGELVIRFLQHLATARASSFGGQLDLATPIIQNLAREHAEAAIRHAFASPTIQPFTGQGTVVGENRQISAAITRL